VTSIMSLFVIFQLSVTGIWSFSNTPNSSLMIGNNFRQMVIQRDSFIYDPERRIATFINSSFPPEVTELSPPYQFTILWWMWVVGAGFAVILCVVVTLLKRHFCDHWCETDFAAELAAVENRALANPEDGKGDVEEQVDQKIPDGSINQEAPSSVSQTTRSVPDHTPRLANRPPPAAISSKYSSEGSIDSPSTSPFNSSNNTPASESRTVGHKRLAAKSLLKALTTGNPHHSHSRTSSMESPAAPEMGSSQYSFGDLGESHQTLEIRSPSPLPSQQLSRSDLGHLRQNSRSPLYTSFQQIPPPSPTTPFVAAEWQVHWDDNKNAHYYYNVRSGESAWQLPPGARLINVTEAAVK